MFHYKENTRIALSQALEPLCIRYSAAALPRLRKAVSAISFYFLRELYNDEVDEGADIYVFNGIEHYIMVNSDYTRISWIQGSNECSILCALSREDAEKMVNSIYERK